MKIFLALFIIFTTSSFCSAGEKIVSVATLNDYAPFCFTEEKYKSHQTIAVGDDAVNFKGYSWDVLRESYHAVGYTIELAVTPWARAMHLLKSGEVDILFPTGKNSSRQRIGYYSEQSLNDVNFVIYVRADNNIKWQGIDSLQGLTIGVKRDFNYGDKWNATTGIKKYQINTIWQGFEMLNAQRLDGFLGYEYTWDYMLKQKHSETKFKKLYVFDSTSEYLMAVKTNPRAKELLGAFDLGKKRLIESGKLDKIKQLWFSNQSNTNTE